MQERIAWPSRCTVHAPHCAAPQPNLVPVRPRSSRSAQSTGVDGSASTRCGRPLTFKVVIGGWKGVGNAGECGPRGLAGASTMLRKNCLILRAWFRGAPASPSIRHMAEPARSPEAAAHAADVDDALAALRPRLVARLMRHASGPDDPAE